MGEGVGRGGKMCHQGLRGGVRWGGEGTELPWEVAGPPPLKRVWLGRWTAMGQVWELVLGK